MSMRFNGGKKFDGTIIEHPSRLADVNPLVGSRRAPRVWIYWNDLFHPGVSNRLRDRLHRMIGHGLDYHIICTKRPEEVVAYWQRPYNPGALRFRKEKLIYLVTMEDQDRANHRGPYAMQLAVNGWYVGVLAEPMLTPIDLRMDRTTHWPVLPVWIICGPENGRGKRPFDGQWAMRLQAEAKRAGVPFYYKAGELNGKRHHETPAI